MTPKGQDAKNANGKMQIFSCTAHVELAEEICDYLGVRLGNLYVHKFANDNLKVKIEENVRNADVYVIQPSCTPVNEGLMELLITLDALKHASAAHITAVVPYYPYARSDKKDEPRISITARLVADLLETAGANRIIAMNLHAPQIQGFARIPADQLLALPLFCDYFGQWDLSNTVAVATDSGGAKMVGEYADRLNIPMAIIDKRRSGDNERAQVRNVVGDVRNKDCVLFDDEVSTAGSLVEGVKVLREFGAKRISAGIVHAVLVGPAVERIQESDLQELVVTNTLPIPPEKQFSKLTTLSVAPLIAEAIQRNHAGESISDLFR